jgi:hypothetical protein
VTNYDRVFAALSDNAQALGESIDGLDQLLRSAPPRLASIDRALEPTRRFARGLDLALARLPDVIGVARPALRELTGLVGPEELPALLRDLRPAVETLPPLTARLTDAFNRLTPVSRCFSRNIIPTLNTEVPDGPLSTGRPVWQDLLHFGAALASFSNTFDGNGIALRLGTQFSEVGLTAQLPGGGKLYGAGDIVGRAPVALNKAEDLQMRPDAPCTEQDLPKLGNRREIGLPAGIERYRRAPSGTAGRALLAALGARDKRGVLDALQRLVPGAKHPTRPARTPARPRRPRPGGRRPVAPTPAPVPAMPEPTVTPKPLLPPLDLDGVNESVNQVLDAVGELLSPRPGSAGTPGRPLDLLKGLSP